MSYKITAVCLLVLSFVACGSNPNSLEFELDSESNFKSESNAESESDTESKSDSATGEPNVDANHDACRADREQHQRVEQFRQPVQRQPGRK